MPSLRNIELVSIRFELFEAILNESAMPPLPLYPIAFSRIVLPLESRMDTPDPVLPRSTVAERSVPIELLTIRFPVDSSPKIVTPLRLFPAMTFP